MENLKINGQDFCNMLKNASNKLEEEKDYVNSLNVFPVPDGDTGTNMSMTFKAAVSEVDGLDNEDIGEIGKKLAKGALMGARGNSGVILSQIFRGIAKGLEGKKEATVTDIKESIVQGSIFAYKAVMRPTEGTILTIIRAAAEGVKTSTAQNVTTLFEEICNNCEAMLQKTPEMLPQLKQAKVVDAGGMGLLILFKGMHQALKEELKVELNTEVLQNKTYEMPSSQTEINTEDIKFGYCTEFMILSCKVDTEAFKNYLEQRGDSIVVVGLDDMVKVHVHTNDPGEIISKALTFGELSKLKIENMREQHRSLLGIDEEKAIEKIETVNKEPIKKYGFVTVGRGEGIKAIFEDLGVDVVIEGGQTMNPSTQDIVNSINKINAETVFILPNNKNIIMAANQAVELVEDKRVVVIPTKTIPQGVTAITMFNSEDDANQNFDIMSEAIGNVISGSVTYAVKDTEQDGKIISEGDILGILEKDIKQVGKDVYAVCEELIKDMINEDSEIITLFYGEDCDKNKVDELVEKLEEKYPDMDIQCFDGKQPLYYFITAVE
ncbi:DAK2 domain-containing protein [Clostridium senegalense]|uniref:DAK2 domain-containing protein n=1 Tax=Clostridium senegalense TaxID=1465809 RepID=A0A6M0GYK1_9CLOT|nr:DAK2 domain-containing protein [Clostridium senegalense]NEU03297.1 DAK2 domain-containing protein [Clostridium senegalense]